MQTKDYAYILWFDELNIEDVPLVGGKNASLGEMYQSLTKKGVNIPNGFAVTAHAYFTLLEKAGIKDKIKVILQGLNTHDVTDLAKRGREIRELIKRAHLPKEIQEKIETAYHKLEKEYGRNVDVAVRSSATAEDLPDASFAGQQETYLNIRGTHDLIEACKKCFASLFTNRAISYRVDKGFDHFSIGLSIGVQKMVRSDLASSGVMFSIDTETGFKNAIFITAAYGLGENVVQGAVNPDEYYVFKPTLDKYKPILSKKVGEKKIKMVYSSGKRTTKNVTVPKDDRKRLVLTNEEILTLAKWAKIIEEHYSKKAGHEKPMDMEWAKDGKSNKLFIVQARPETVHSLRNQNVFKKYFLKKKGKSLVTGKSVGEKISSGKVHVIKEVTNIADFKKGEVLVTDITDPDWEPVMKIAAAIITNRGGRTSHAAIVSRELGIPCIVGTNKATEILKQVKEVTIDCSQGEEGIVYKGKLPYVVKEHKLDKLPETNTHIMMNIGNPEEAFKLSQLPNDGVGLARQEFIINSAIKIHPLALIHFNNIKNKELKQLIAEQTYLYKDKKQFFVDKLAEGIGTIAAAFYPKEVIVRMSDFKSNEYANLIGGTLYEPEENNPMIGWRGASRYYHEQYRQAFGLECKAIKKVREEFGLVNVVPMIPFCRTVGEAKKVIYEMNKQGLKQRKKKLKIYCMCEIPSNVLLADEFLDVFDGFSIGTNDLTQLTLGLDRDSAIVSKVYDERNQAVKNMISRVIKIANKKKKYIGLCGDAPSSVPGFAEFLVGAGIHSMSVTADVIIQTRLKVKKAESLRKR